ncbi:hypothetical protein GCM10010124_37200 [Pilimelia terevasa]|uniref:Uncharacterized protein n=1 Tax=Pilimelia terevasa TaxID=53372 RepID=A0A8J3FLC8_9ACTN|nr:hypothetical protein [Pilimelia terevasa]GGK40912.1 hypothetical protein GCM10010124_37200 [Pilimelia terevasa]
MTSSLAAPGGRTAPAAADPPPAADRPAAGPPGGRRRMPRWLPALAAAAPCLVAAHHYGAGWGPLGAFGAYVMLVLAVPGTLLWRLAHGRARSLAEDLAPGLAVGYVGEVLGYFAGRAVGLPLLHLVLPAGVLAAFAAVRPLRRYWRAAPDAARPPAGWLWTMAGTAGLLVLWACVYFMRSRGATYSLNDADLPFHLALIGELKHHLPPTVPWVSGEPLHYHWFAYADLAATSWSTGIEPETLLLRLYFLPLLAVLPFAVGALARRLTGRWWPGPVAMALTLFAVAPYPYGWGLPATYVSNGLGPVEDGVLLRFGLFASPTQTFAAVLALPLVLLLVDRLRGDGRGWRVGALLAAFVAVLCGAKATYLPIILCGLLLVVGLELVRHRRWHRAALGCVAFVVPGILFAQFVLFGGASQGMVVDPLGGLGRYGLGAATGIGATKFGAVPTTGLALVAVTGVTLLAWLAIWGGTAGLARARRDPATPLLLGIGAAGMGGALALNQYGFSQTWFLAAARPYLALAAAAGLAALLPAAGPALRRVADWLVGAAGAGLLAVYGLRALGPAQAPTVRADGRRRVLLELLWPNAALVGLAVLAALAGWLVARRAGLALALAAALLGGATLPGVLDVFARDARAARAQGFPATDARRVLMPAGAREAGRWLRTHSDPDDLVATNAHCRRPEPCDNLHFWFAGLSERRFLVEGWGYTATVNRIQTETGQSGNLIGYWRPAVLADNDAAFQRPDAATVGRLRGHYGVRWLLVDTRVPRLDEAGLGRHAALRYRAGETAVYAL